MGMLLLCVIFYGCGISMKRQSLIVGLCAACFLLPVFRGDADAVEKHQQGAQLVVQQSESDRAERLTAEGDRLRAEGDSDSLLRAVEVYQEALDIFERLASQQEKADVLLRLGFVYNSIGEKDKALEHYEQALPIFREVGNRFGEAATLNNIGLIYDSIGEKSKALEYYEQALPIRREVRDRSGEATPLKKIGLF